MNEQNDLGDPPRAWPAMPARGANSAALSRDLAFDLGHTPKYFVPARRRLGSGQGPAVSLGRRSCARDKVRWVFWTRD
jgi:hypothetical protein